MKKFTIGILLIWAFFAGHAFGESIGLIFNAQENVTKTCELAISLVQQGIKTDNDRNHVLSQPIHLIPAQNAFSSPLENKILLHNNHNKLPENSHTLFFVLRL